MTDIIDQDTELKRKAYDEFVANNSLIIERWNEAHSTYFIRHTEDGGKEVEIQPNRVPLPIIWNDITKEFIWINRALRRKTVKQSRKPKSRTRRRKYRFRRT